MVSQISSSVLIGGIWVYEGVIVGYMIDLRTVKSRHEDYNSLIESGDLVSMSGGL